MTEPLKFELEFDGIRIFFDSESDVEIEIQSAKYGSMKRDSFPCDMHQIDLLQNLLGVARDMLVATGRLDDAE